jgi:hypothetical protein
MSNQHILHDAVTQFESTFDNEPLLEILSARVLGLLGESIAQLKGKQKDAASLATLTDEQLLAKIVVMLSSKRAMVNERDLRKQKKQLEAKQHFFQLLEKYGGLYKAGEVAQILGLSRQTINNQRIGGKLLSILEGNDYLFPAFQFGENAKLEHIELVLNALKTLSPITQCSFFINKIDIAGVVISPLELLRRTPNERELTALKRQASLFGSPAPD